MLINIAKHSPKGTDKYFVDSNVWFWFTYAGSNEIQSDERSRYQLKIYPDYIEKILDEGARLFHSPLTLSELTSVIEKTEYDVYCQRNPEQRISKKKFRAKPDCRKRVLSEVSTAWKTINQISECLDITLNSNIANEALAKLNDSMLDPYDAFFLHSMANYSVDSILTDDGDFVGSGVSVYTANNKVSKQRST